FHDFEDFHEIAFLIGEQFVDGFYTTFEVVGEDHFTDVEDAFSIEKHVLGAAESDSFGAVFATVATIKRSFRIGANFYFSEFVGPSHEFVEVFVQDWINGFDLSEVDFSIVSGKGNHITFFDHHTFYFKLLFIVVDLYLSSSS